MACFNSVRSNCQGPYYPCPVCCCACNCSSNSVVNPVIESSFAFLNLPTTATVASGATVPVAIVFNNGTSIIATTTGEVNLAVGTYQLTYNVTSVVGASGTNSFGISINGATFSPSITTVSGTAGETVSVSNGVIISVVNPSVIRLVNLGTDDVSVTRANLTIRKID